MTRAITSDELALLRSGETWGQWTKLYLAVLKPNTIYTARLDAVPSSNDQVYEVSYDTPSGTLSDVKPGMTLYVGTTAGAHDLGMCRIRTAPDEDTFFIGEISEIKWIENPDCYLTVVDEFDVWARHIHVDEDGELLMDVNIAYDDQHSVFDPVPVIGTHAVLWKTGATVDALFDAGNSWVFDSTIEEYLWEAPGSSAIADEDTATPTVTYDAAGIYAVYCTVTAANEKTATGVRYVFVYDDDNPPSTVFQLANCEGSVDAGGWMFDVTMQAEATLSEIRERTMVVLFARDYFNGQEQSIGPLENRENIIAVGRVSGESIRWDPVAGQVHFNVYGPHYWLNKISVSACQLEFKATPANWNGMKDLTPDRALWHLAHWRSNITQIMDFYPTNDERLDNKIATLANKLWAQMTEFAGLKIMAHVLCDRFGSLYAQIDPQMIPEADRSSIPVVMTITAQDWTDTIEFERAVVHETGQVNISTRFINESGVSVTKYSLSPGHIPRRYGDWEINDGMLCESQAHSNQLAGLLLGWKDNEFPDIPVKLWGNNRFVDIAPNQYLDITIAPGDTPRDVGYDGNIIPRRVALRYDAEARWLSLDLSNEGVTEEQISANGDIPGSSDVDLSIPPLPPLPPLPELPPTIPGGSDPTETGPKKILLHDPTYGFVYSDSFAEEIPLWRTVNAGLTTIQLQNANFMFVCPNGAFYVGRCDVIEASDVGTGATNSPWIARAPYIGGTFVIVEDENTLFAKYSTYPTLNHAIKGCWFNPLVAESVAYIMGENTSTIDLSDFHIWIGSGTTFTQEAAVTNIHPDLGFNGLSYGQGSWIFYGERAQLFSPSGYWKFTADGATLSDQDQIGDISEFKAIRASTTGTLFTIGYFSGDIRKTIDDGANWTMMTAPSSSEGFACDPSGLFCMLASNGKERSSDGLAVMSALPSLPVASHWQFAFAGAGESSLPRFVAAYATVYYTPDFGTTWFNKTGALNSVVTFPLIDMVLVTEY